MSRLLSQVSHLPRRSIPKAPQAPLHLKSKSVFPLQSSTDRCSSQHKEIWTLILLPAFLNDQQQHRASRPQLRTDLRFLASNSPNFHSNLSSSRTVSTTHLFKPMNPSFPHFVHSPGSPRQRTLRPKLLPRARHFTSLNASLSRILQCIHPQTSIPRPLRARSPEHPSTRRRLRLGFSSRDRIS